jgi:SAM-dependent methyltransferase
VSSAKFDAAAAERWSQDAYADPARYLGHRAELIRSLGPPLEPGDRVLDLACGDGGLAGFLLPHGLRYLGVDASPAMVEAAQARLGQEVEIALGTVDDFRPEDTVAATTIFRALYYASDRLAFFRHAAAYTDKKLVFDLNPRQYRLGEIRAELVDAGFRSLVTRPFLVPQTVSLPRPLLTALVGAERVGPLARALLRFRFTYICAASKA